MDTKELIKNKKKQTIHNLRYSDSQSMHGGGRVVCVACQMEINETLTLCWCFPSVSMFSLWMCGFCMWSVGNNGRTKGIYKNVQYRNVTHFPDAQYSIHMYTEYW